MGSEMCIRDRYRAGTTTTPPPIPKSPAINPAKIPVLINNIIENSKSPEATLLNIVVNT